MKKLEIKTPAKINLGLRILEKRPDGYHNLETIFYPINLFDKLTFEESEEFHFTSNSPVVKSFKDNLVIKAKEKLEQATKRKLNCKIDLEKNIPIGGGLGGGSSDCAATLKGLNDFFNLNLSTEDLTNLALQLGSDVPFFINPVPSYARGRGEILSPIELKISYPVLIINPNIHISTKWAFSKLTRKHDNCGSKVDSLLKLVKEFNFDFLFNDFEQVVFKEFNILKDLKSFYYQCGAIYAAMTGTGASMFGIFKNSTQAQKMINKLPKDYFIFLNQVE